MTERCRAPRCGRPLRTTESQERGYGPVCYRREFGSGWRLVPITAPSRTGAAAELPLFDLPGAPASGAPRPTVGERQRARHAEAVRRGYHPLGVALRINLPLHGEAAPFDDRAAPGARCGTCVHRVVPLREVARTYPKCNFGGDWRRATGGPGTDVRAFWPACKDYQPKETAK